mmetsp:Transcript_25444/g.73464  ORF Transcript_25444/g.73464 Transcript_25444/m.73464 type:complete len:254 (+) Transcript_25444:46-807(+)
MSSRPSGVSRLTHRFFAGFVLLVHLGARSAEAVRHPGYSYQSSAHRIHVAMPRAKHKRKKWPPCDGDCAHAAKPGRIGIKATEFEPTFHEHQVREWITPLLEGTEQDDKYFYPPEKNRLARAMMHRAKPKSRKIDWASDLADAMAAVGLPTPNTVREEDVGPDMASIREIAKRVMEADRQQAESGPLPEQHRMRIHDFPILPTLSTPDWQVNKIPNGVEWVRFPKPKPPADAAPDDDPALRQVQGEPVAAAPG